MYVNARALIERRVSLAIKSDLREAFPNLEIENTCLIGEGFRSVAVEADDCYVFLIGKHAQAAKSFAKEYEVLPKLAPLLSVEIPNPLGFVTSASFPHGVLCYSKICGRILTEDLIAKVNLKNLAQDVARFLIELHGFKSGDLGLMLSRFFERDQKLRDDVLPTLKRVLPRGEYLLIEDWWRSYLDRDVNFDFEPVFIHGDLWYENLILDANLKRLVGILDFEACGLGDVAREFAPLNYLGKDFLEDVISEYTSQSAIEVEELKKSIRYQSIKREFGGVRHSIVCEDEGELRDAIKKVRSRLIVQ